MVDVIVKIKKDTPPKLTPGNAVTMLIFHIRFIYIIWFFFFLENAKDLGCSDDAKWRIKVGRPNS